MQKYTPEIVENICKLLADGQTIAYAVQSEKVAQKTFYEWKKKYPDFAEKVRQAENKYKQNCPDGIKRAAKDRIQELVTFGHKIRREKTNTIIHEIPVRDETGTVIDYKELWRQVHTEVEETNRGCPQWALDRVLPAPPKDLESAIKMIEAYGLKTIVANTEVFREWLIAQTTSQNSENGTGKGLTESEANQIRARILGVSEDATDTVAVPATVDEG